MVLKIIGNKFILKIIGNNPLFSFENKLI